MHELLRHRRRLADDHDAGRDVEEEHQPQHPELSCAHRFANGEVVGRCRLGDGAPRLPASRTPAGGRIRVALRRGNNEDEIDNAENFKRRRHAARDDRSRRERAHDQCAGAVSRDRDAGHQPAAIREPFRDRRDRRDVAHPHTDAAEDAITEIQAAQRLARREETGEQIAHAVDHPGHRRDRSRSGAVLPQPPEDRPEAKKRDRDREVQRDLGQGPARGVHERLDEHAPAVGRAQADLHDHRGRGDEPSAPGRTRGRPRGGQRLIVGHERSDPPRDSC